MALFLHMIIGLVFCTSVALAFEEDEALQCISSSRLSLIQNDMHVQIQRNQELWPSIDDIVDTVSNGVDSVTDAIDSVKDVAESATNTIVTKPLVHVLGGFDTVLITLDRNVREFWHDANLSISADLSSIAGLINGSTDSAAVNAALTVDVMAIDVLIVRWSNLSSTVDTTFTDLLNDLSTVGFKSLSASMSDSLDSALLPLQEVNDKLLVLKKHLQSGSKPWVDNAATDYPLHEAIKTLEQTKDEMMSKKNLVIDWLNRTVDLINNITHKTLAGDQAEKIATALHPIQSDAKILFDDLFGGLFDIFDSLSATLLEVRSITAKAASASTTSATTTSATPFSDRDYVVDDPIATPTTTDNVVVDPTAATHSTTTTTTVAHGAAETPCRPSLAVGGVFAFIALAPIVA